MLKQSTPTVLLLLLVVAAMGHSVEALRGESSGWGLSRSLHPPSIDNTSLRHESAFAAATAGHVAHANQQHSHNDDSDDDDEDDDTRMENAFWQATSPHEHARLRHIEDSFSKKTKRTTAMQTELEHLESLALPCGGYRDRRPLPQPMPAFGIET